MNIEELEQRYDELLPFLSSLDYIAEATLLKDMLATLKKMDAILNRDPNKCGDGCLGCRQCWHHKGTADPEREAAPDDETKHQIIWGDWY